MNSTRGSTDKHNLSKRLLLRQVYGLGQKQYKEKNSAKINSVKLKKLEMKKRTNKLKKTDERKLTSVSETDNGRIFVPLRMGITVPQVLS